jgi:hypothetical protein
MSGTGILETICYSISDPTSLLFPSLSCRPQGQARFEETEVNSSIDWMSSPLATILSLSALPPLPQCHGGRLERDPSFPEARHPPFVVSCGSRHHTLRLLKMLHLKGLWPVTCLQIRLLGVKILRTFTPL